MNRREKVTILLVEDNPADVYLIREMLSEKTNNVILEHADSLAKGIARIDSGGIDIVLLDLGLPDSQGISIVKNICERFSQLPIIVFTGLSDEQVGLQAVQDGAQDYLIKGQTNSSLLVKAILYAIERKQLENEKERLIGELQESLAKVKILSGLLPMCASCKKIRDDKGYWNQVELYIIEHSEAKFTHGICPECVKKLYPEYYDKISRGEE
ncbi:MAG: response regulator [Dissulfurispiraceae bacterium]|jgi:CheY-like chemotaxis protein